MNISIKGHHVVITDALQEAVHSKLAKPLRHFDKIQSLHVILSRDNHHSENAHNGKNIYAAEAILRVLGQEMFVKSTQDDIYKAIGEMADMLTRQVRKHKTRLERRHFGDKRADIAELAAYADEAEEAASVAV